jgi:hypothetical protein
LACQDEFFANHSLEVKENYEHALGFALHPPQLLSVSVSLDLPSVAHAFFPERSFNQCQGLYATFSEICTRFDAQLLLDPAQNRIRPDTRLQIKRT